MTVPSVKIGSNNSSAGLFNTGEGQAVAWGSALPNTSATKDPIFFVGQLPVITQPRQATPLAVRFGNKTETSSQAISLSNQALFMAQHVDAEIFQLQQIAKRLENLSSLPPEEAQNILNLLQSLAQNYISLAAAPFQKPEDASLVRRELNNLAAQTFSILAKAADAYPDQDIKRKAFLYEGYELLARGDIEAAKNVFARIRNDFPEAAAISQQIEGDQLKSLNFSALDAWSTSIEEGEAVTMDGAQGIIGTGVGFVDWLFRKEGTHLEDLHAKFDLDRDLVTFIKKQIKDGKVSTIEETLKKISKEGPEEFKTRSQELLSHGHSRDNAGSYAVANIIHYTSEIPPSSDMAELLLHDADQLETRYAVVQTPFAIYSILQASSQEESILKKSSVRITALSEGKDLPTILIDMLQSTGTDDAVQIVLMAGASKVGAITKLATLTKLQSTGITGYRALAIAYSAEAVAEGSTLWALNTAHDSLSHDTSKIFTSDHLSKSYGANLLMMGTLKGFGFLSRKFSPQLARTLGLVTEGGAKLSQGGSALVWGLQHLAGVSGMATSTQASQLFGLSEAPKGGFKESMAHDVASYIKYSIAQKGFDRVLGEKYAKARENDYRQIALKEAQLMAEAHVKTLGFKTEVQLRAEAYLNALGFSFVAPQADAWNLYLSLIPETYNLLSNEEKASLHDEFESTYPNDPRKISHPLKSEAKMKELIRVAKLLGNQYPNVPIYGIGASPEWFLTAAKSMDSNPNRFKHIAFSGNWYTNFHGNIENAFDLRPSDADIAKCRQYLLEQGLDPSTIIKRKTQTIVVDAADSGQGYMSFLRGILLDWATEIGHKEELLSKLKVVILTHERTANPYLPPPEEDLKKQREPFQKIGFQVDIITVKDILILHLQDSEQNLNDRFVPSYKLGTDPTPPATIPLSRKSALVWFKIIDHLMTSTSH